MYTEFSGGDLSSIFQFAQETVPFYSAMLLGTILAVITLSMYFMQESKTGRKDFPSAFAVGNTITTVLAVILSMITDFISGNTLGIFIGITIVSYIILFYSNR